MMDTLRLLGQALECSVCLEQLDTSSKVLPCQHTFCQKCLVDIINTRKELRCPECRVLVTVPFTSLPPNILLMRILEGIKKIPPDAESPLENLIQLPSPDQQSQSVADPFSFLSRITTDTTLTTTDSGRSGSCGTSFHTPVSQSQFNNPFLGAPTEVSVTSSSLRSFPVSASQNGGIASFHVGSSDFTAQSNIASSSVLSVSQSTSSSNSSPHHSDTLSSLNKGTPSTNSSSPLFHTSLSAFPTQPHSGVSPSDTSCRQPTYTLASSSALTQTSMSVLSTISDSSSIIVSSSSSSHTQWPSSSSQGSLPESQPVPSSTRSESHQPANIKACVARQASTKSLKEFTAHPFVPPLNIQAKALYSYDGKEARDLKFKKGDMLTLCKQIDENWYMGELDGNFGIVPASYVKLQDSSASNIPQCKALYDFKMVSEEERSCLMFTKGETITVLRRIDDNWAEGKLNTHIGIFPLSFVELNDAAKTLIRLSGSVAPNSLHLSTTAVTISPPPSVSTTIITTSLAAPYPPTHSIPQTAQQPSFQIGKQENELPLATERHSLSDSQTSTRSTPLPSNPSASASSSVTRISSGSCTITSSSPKTCASSNQIKRTGSAVGHTLSDAVDSSRPRSASLLTTESHQLYIALYTYRPRKADELELKKGQLYSVGDKCQDGWFKGRCLASDKIGVFPGNYVQLADSQTVAALFSRTPRDASTPSCHVTWTALKSSPAYNYITYGRPKSATFGGQLCTTGDGRTAATNGSVIPPELPPRAATASGKPLAMSAQFSNSSVERSPPESLTCRSSPPCSSPVSHLGDKQQQQQQKPSSIKDPSSVGGPNGSGISLMRKLTVGGKRKPKSPPLLSVDNPVFEEANINRNKTSSTTLERSDKSCDITAKSTKQPAPLVRERYRCIVPYPANSGYELELQVGDIVYVHKKREDGWLKGTLQRTGKTGLFPSIFVESC